MAREMQYVIATAAILLAEGFIYSKMIKSFKLLSRQTKSSVLLIDQEQFLAFFGSTVGRVCLSCHKAGLHSPGGGGGTRKNFDGSVPLGL